MVGEPVPGWLQLLWEQASNGEVQVLDMREGAPATTFDPNGPDVVVIPHARAITPIQTIGIDYSRGPDMTVVACVTQQAGKTLTTAEILERVLAADAAAIVSAHPGHEVCRITLPEPVEPAPARDPRPWLKLRGKRHPRRR